MIARSPEYWWTAAKRKNPSILPNREFSSTASSNSLAANSLDVWAKEAKLIVVIFGGGGAAGATDPPVGTIYMFGAIFWP
jgi:hypothetical protein